ncbi:hypothetical protein R3I94_014254 [Phoxinus phoxinus]
MATPYSQGAPLQVKCVGNRRSQKALTFVSSNNVIDVGAFKVTTISALTDGQMCYICIKNGSDPEFEEGGSYVVKNYTLSKKYGRQCIFINRSSRKFKTAPLAITEEAERAAKEVLCPPSRCVTGEERDICKSPGYLSLQGKIEKVQVARMTRAQFPILDLSLRCGDQLHDISLWRDEALVELYVGDKVEVTHLRANIRPNGGGKFDSSNYTTVKIVERQILETVLTIIGVSEGDSTLILLDSEMEDYTVPSHFYTGSINDLVQQLPIRVKVQHIKHCVLKLKHLDKVEAMDPVEAAESLDLGLVKVAESLDLGLVEEAESLDLGLVEEAESLDLDLVEAAESLDLGLVKVAESLDLGLVDEAESLDLDLVEEAESLDLGLVEEAESLDLDLVEEAESLDLVEEAESLDLVEEAESLDLVEEVESLDLVEEVESLDLVEEAESLDLVEEVESLDLVEEAESLDLVEEVESLDLVEVEYLDGENVN